MKALILPEHLLLLAMREDKGDVVHSGALALPYGLNGALILELSLQRRVKVHENVMSVIDGDLTGDAILDEALKVLQASDHPHSAEYWIARPESLVKDLRHRLLERLAERGILRREEHRFLWLIPYERFPEMDGEPERNLRQHIHDVVMGGAEPDEPTALLVALINACDLSRDVFHDLDPNEVKVKLKASAEGEQIARAITDDVAAATTAAVTSTLMASVIPTIHTP